MSSKWRLIKNYDDFKNDIISSISSCIIWVVWEFAGIRYIWEKLNPPTSYVKNTITYKAPVSFGILLITIYIAAFQLSNTLYENRFNVIETRISSACTLLGVDKKNFGMLIQAQLSKCPTKPEIFNPYSIYSSLFKTSYNEQTFDRNIMNEVKGIIVCRKEELSGAQLQNARLCGAGLFYADLRQANLTSTNLVYADRDNANLERQFFIVLFLQMQVLKMQILKCKSFECNFKKMQT